jgi:5-methylcytosine-specific restriction endonuclease McrA
MDSSLLSEPTLVLNKEWLPVRISTARRAFVLLYKDVARALVPDTYALLDFQQWTEVSIRDGDLSIQAVSLRIRIPEIIVLRHCDRFIRPQVVFSRRNLFRRDQYTCQYCGARGSTDSMSIDHIVPRALGGGASWTNCVAACRSCNTRKGDRSLKEAGMKLLRPPREPSPHLVFSYQGGRRKESWKHFVAPFIREAGVGS